MLAQGITEKTEGREKLEDGEECWEMLAVTRWSWLPAQDQASRNSYTDGEEALQAPPALH